MKINKQLLKTPLGQFRLIALLEGISFILLLLAMPAKYLFHYPIFVFVLGRVHGFLVIIYLVWLFILFLEKRFSFAESFVAVLVSLIPFGTFYADHKWWSIKQNQEDGKA